VESAGGVPAEPAEPAEPPAAEHAAEHAAEPSTTLDEVMEDCLLWVAIYHMFGFFFVNIDSLPFVGRAAR
jgi:hypothetical protein